MGSLRRPLRGWLDGGVGHPVQVAALPSWARADLGLQRTPGQQGEERNILSHEAAARARTARAVSVVARVNGRRARSAAWIAKSRDQAVRRLRPDERRQRDSGRLQRCVGRHRRRREVRTDAEPDRRLHLQHGLRAGRSRRTAGQPHALQPVLPGEARVLPREPRPVRFRRRGHEQWRRHADSVLQPPHRLRHGESGSDSGRRTRHRQGGPIQPRHAEHRHEGGEPGRSRRRPTFPSCA